MDKIWHTRRFLLEEILQTLINVSENGGVMNNLDGKLFSIQIILAMLSGLFGGIIALVGQTYLKSKENKEIVESHKFLMRMNLIRMKGAIGDTYQRLNKKSDYMISPINIYDST